MHLDYECRLFVADSRPIDVRCVIQGIVRRVSSCQYLPEYERPDYYTLRGAVGALGCGQYSYPLHRIIVRHAIGIGNLRLVPPTIGLRGFGVVGEIQPALRIDWSLAKYKAGARWLLPHEMG